MGNVIWACAVCKNIYGGERATAPKSHLICPRDRRRYIQYVASILVCSDECLEPGRLLVERLAKEARQELKAVKSAG